MNIILPSSQPEFFQGEELPRTSSPFGKHLYQAYVHILTGDHKLNGSIAIQHTWLCRLSA